MSVLHGDFSLMDVKIRSGETPKSLILCLLYITLDIQTEHQRDYICLSVKIFALNHLQEFKAIVNSKSFDLVHNGSQTKMDGTHPRSVIGLNKFKRRQK